MKREYIFNIDLLPDRAEVDAAKRVLDLLPDEWDEVWAGASRRAWRYTPWRWVDSLIKRLRLGVDGEERNWIARLRERLFPGQAGIATVFWFVKAGKWAGVAVDDPRQFLDDDTRELYLTRVRATLAKVA